jgi:hypothetical protein
MRSSWLSTQPPWKARGVRSSSVNCASCCDGGGCGPSLTPVQGMRSGWLPPVVAGRPVSRLLSR